jgi:hypothetical protein
VALALCVVGLDELLKPPTRRITHPRPTERILAFLNSPFIERNQQVRRDAMGSAVIFLYVFLTVVYRKQMPPPDLEDLEDYFHTAAQYF